MTRGILLSIGCDKYAEARDLASGELDAEGVFSALTCGPAALYDAEQSILLRSPTRTVLEDRLSSILKRYKGVSSFAVYFAGHGAISDGSLYLCPSDVSLDALSVTAINISQILRVICELRPTHAYVIIDACFSGGIALDFGSVLRSDILDRSPGFGLSVLASAHMSKGAAETSRGGLFTCELLKVLQGAYVINDTQPFLGLGEIIRGLEQSSALKEQAPNFWELNLTGADAFCGNPAVKSATATDTTFGTLRYSSHQSTLSADVTRRLWRKYLDLPTIDSGELAPLFRCVVEDLATAPETLGSSSFAISDSFARALEAHPDTFAPALSHAAMVRALMPFQAIPEAKDASRKLLNLARTCAERALSELSEGMRAEEFHLLGDGGPADLYFLPLRLSKILGWVGFVSMASRLLAAASDRDTLHGLARELLDQYGASVVAVSDDQASSVLIFLAECFVQGWQVEAEEVVGALYLDFNESYGRILINDPKPSDIVDYLLLKHRRPFDCEDAFLQNPPELLSVILMGAVMLGLDDELDETLVQLDRTNFSFYIPASYADFHQESMGEGMTLLFQLGHAIKPGYGVWRIQDMRRGWCHEIAPLIADAVSECDEVVQLSAILASLSVPDRLPWFIVPKIRNRTAIPVPH